MGKEEICLRRQNYDSEQVLWVLQITLQVEGAKLRYEEFKVVSENGVEVGIDPTLFEVFDGSLLMSVHPHHGFGHDLIMLALSLVLNVEPLLKPGDKSLLGDFLGLFAANTAAEHVIEATASPKQTSSFGVLFFFRDNVIQQLFSGRFVIRIDGGHI